MLSLYIHASDSIETNQRVISIEFLKNIVICIQIIVQKIQRWFTVVIRDFIICAQQFENELSPCQQMALHVRNHTRWTMRPREQSSEHRITIDQTCFVPKERESCCRVQFRSASNAHSQCDTVYVCASKQIYSVPSYRCFWIGQPLW